MLRVMERRNFPVSSLRLLASPRSSGKTLTFRGESHTIKPLNMNSFEDIDIAIFSAGGAISRDFAPEAVRHGAVVVDNSSAFRMHADVPLVVPEINGADVKNHKGILANPNCTTAITLLALYPLHRPFGLKRIFASSYQAVSGAGARAIDELRHQTDCVAKHKPVLKEIFPHQIAFNVIPQVDSFLDTGYTKEEMKMQNEGRRIMHLPNFKASVTCVRTPVYRAHSIAVSAPLDSNSSPMVIRCLWIPLERTIVLPVVFASIVRWKMDSLSGFAATSCSKEPLSMRFKLPNYSDASRN